MPLIDDDSILDDPELTKSEFNGFPIDQRDLYFLERRFWSMLKSQGITVGPDTLRFVRLAATSFLYDPAPGLRELDLEDRTRMAGIIFKIAITAPYVTREQKAFGYVSCTTFMYSIIQASRMVLTDIGFVWCDEE